MSPKFRRWRRSPRRARSGPSEWNRTIPDCSDCADDELGQIAIGNTPLGKSAVRLAECERAADAEFVRSFSQCQSESILLRGSMGRAMSTHISCLLIAASVLCMAGARTFAATCDAPRPNLVISAPPTSVSRDAAAFSGVWAGTWLLQGRRGNRIRQCARIHVQVNDNHNAAVAYCYGARPDARTLARCDKYRATIRGAQLRFVVRRGFHISLRLRRPGTAQGTMSFPAYQRTDFADFHKL